MSIHRGMSYSQYAADTAFLRSGDLVSFLESPQLYRDRLSGLASRKSKALAFGTSAHMAILEPSRYAAEVVAQPATYANDKGEVKDWNNNANVCKAWYAAAYANGQTPLTGSDMASLALMHDRMPIEVRELFVKGEAEVVIRGELHGVEAQCRADWLDVERGLVTEFKTIGNMATMEKSIHTYSYHVQSRFYYHLIRAEIGTLTSRIVFCETRAPFRWRVVELDLDYIGVADTAIRDGIEQLKARRKSGCWTDSESVYQLVSPPAWMDSDDMNEDEEGYAA